MLATVFLLYVGLMVCMIRQTEHDNVLTNGSAGKWGPKIANSEKILRDRLETFAQKTRRKEPSLPRQSRKLPQAAHPVIKGGGANDSNQREPNDVTIDSRANIRGSSKDMEEVDIHDMKRPEEVNQARNNRPVKDKPEAVAKQQKADEPMAEQQRVLKAYLEPIHLKDWETKPLPVRTTATLDQLTVLEYPRVNSCSRLPELWPVDDYPDADPFLPWIHDVFPTDNGKFIQFVAQNKRRCRTGTTPEDTAILENMQPQIALFQHVPVKRITTQDDTSTSKQTRYQLTSHQEADADGIETRFVCQFHPSGQETLSVSNVQYDYAAKRKGQQKTFTKTGHHDNKSIHTSQLVFKCPVPADLVDVVREGTSVINDQATMFVTLVPIRTPPRYGMPNRFLPPYYQDPKHNNFSVPEEWGDAHILPRIVDSGRWENIPICKPTWKAYAGATSAPPTDEKIGLTPTEMLHLPGHTKKNRLIACTWASAQYATRGERFAIDDGARRLDEWIRFHLLAGVDHIVIYDNSPGEKSLKPVTDQFPDQVTRIPWPATICNNNRSFEDSPGERSSQYAAESSWRLRFGPHTDWMATMDIDEYIVPVGEYTSLKPFLDELDKNGTKIISFGSWRAWPRRDLIEPPEPIRNKTICNQEIPCFSLKIPSNRSILQTYNCDRQTVKAEHMPAEKQIFRTDYVLQHYVHYSTITLFGEMNALDTVAAGFKFARASPDPLARFADEVSEVTMLHTKALATQDTTGWEARCTGKSKGTCRIGVPFPSTDDSLNVTKDDDGWLYNCYVNPKVEQYWVPQLDKQLKQSKQRMDIQR
jgi:hypothetical protein